MSDSDVTSLDLMNAQYLLIFISLQL